MGERAIPFVEDPFFPVAVWEPYTLVDLFASYKVLDAVTLNVSVENLFDRYYVDALEPSALPSPGRTVRVGMTAKF